MRNADLGEFHVVGFDLSGALVAMLPGGLGSPVKSEAEAQTFLATAVGQLFDRIDELPTSLQLRASRMMVIEGLVYGLLRIGMDIPVHWDALEGSSGSPTLN